MTSTLPMAHRLAHRLAHRRRGARRLAVVAAPALALALLAGCGSGGSSTAGSGASASSAADGQDVGSGAARIDAVELTRKVTAAMRDKGTAKLVSSGIMPMTAHLRMTASGMDLESTAGNGPTPIRMVIVDGVGYVNVGMSVGGKHWMKVTSDAGAGVGGSLGQMKQLSDPGAMLKGLEGQVQAVRGGTETVDGVSTTEYTVTLDAEQLAVAMKSMSSGSGQPAVDLTGASTVTRYYVDADWLPHKIVTDSTLKGQQVPTTTITYSEWGRPVTITAPDPADVRPAPKL